MTNGEKLDQVFPDGICPFSKNWLDYEYKEPTTKNDLVVDCVARKDIERYIEGFINEYTPKEELEFINLELDGLKHIPTVTPQEPRKGHWIKVTNGRGGHECDVCHDYAPSFQSGDEYLSTFCPNCGAKMNEVEE